MTMNRAAITSGIPIIFLRRASRKRRQAQKVMIDEYAMNYTFGIGTSPVIQYPQVQDTGFNKAHLVYWEPENAWLKK